MDKMILRILLFFGLTQYAFQAPALYAGEIPVSWGTAADILPGDRGLSVFRYGAFGTGAFPYASCVPPNTVPVRVDDVPMTSFSPFGVDLESVPVLFVDSLAVVDDRLIRIATIDSIPENPLTRVSFLTGERRRSGFQGTFQRKTSAKSGILVGGMSRGIRGNALIEGNSSRLYSVKYIRSLKGEAVATAVVSGSRDRADLTDFEKRQRMGERETDNLLLAMGIKRYPISARTVMGVSAYFRNGISRFVRYDGNSSFDDDGFGLSASLVSRKMNSAYSLDASSDARLFEGRNTEAEWRGNTTRILGSGIWTRPAITIDLNCGGLYSSKYGEGVVAAGGLSLPLPARITGVLRGSFSHGFPGPEQIYFPSLIFSDSLQSSDIGRYRIAELETGVKKRWGTVDVGLYGFGARSNAPFFSSGLDSMVMRDDRWYSGARVYITAQGGRGLHHDASLRMEYIGGSSPRYIWPRPALDIQTRGNLSRDFFRGNLHAVVFGNTRLVRWSSGPASPEGAHFFLDGGISFRVSSLTAFYTVENITGTDMRWFDILRWQGRNSFWGVQWNLRD